MTDPILFERFEAAARRGFRHDARPSHQAKRALVLGARLARRLGIRSVRVPATTFWGDRMSVLADERSVSRAILMWGLWEPGLTRMMLEGIRPGATFVDVGAHIGYFSVLAARLVGPEGTVHAFEPAPETFRLLTRNLSGYPRAQPFAQAVFSSTTELVFRDYGPRYSVHNTLSEEWKAPPQRDAVAVERRIPAVSLDDHVERTGIAPSFVKIDAESAEHEILEGMRSTIERHRPAVSMEVGDVGVEGAPPSETVVRGMLELGYTAWESDGGPLRPHDVKPVYEMVDNVLFLPPGRSPGA